MTKVKEHARQFHSPDGDTVAVGELSWPDTDRLTCKENSVSMH